MLKSLERLLASLLPVPSPGGGAPATDEHALQLAAAVMLVEVMRADAGISAAEREAVQSALAEKFALSPQEAATLAELAQETARTSIDLYAFTSRIHEHFEMPRKLQMIEMMWRVAYADGRLGEHERHMIWRIADLLHIPQGALHHARQRAMPQAPAPAPGPD